MQEVSKNGNTLVGKALAQTKHIKYTKEPNFSQNCFLLLNCPKKIDHARFFQNPLKGIRFENPEYSIGLC